MYRAKASSQRIEPYRAERDDSGGRLRLMGDLRRAIDRNQLLLHYQPQLELATGRISAVEALLRWPHPTLGMVPPLDFLPLAEESGLMPELTRWVFATALRQLAAWREDGRALRLSANASISNLLDPTFSPMVSSQLKRFRIPAQMLTVEITETSVIQDPERCGEAIAGLSALGVDTAIDDFGAGFTALASLTKLQLRELTLDRTFISDLGVAGSAQQAVVRSTLGLGHALGLRVVAEGVEDRQTLQWLEEADCDLAQGYFVSRPVEAGAVLDLTGHDLVETQSERNGRTMRPGQKRPLAPAGTSSEGSAASAATGS